MCLVKTLSMKKLKDKTQVSLMLSLSLGVDKNIVDEDDHKTVQVRFAHAVHDHGLIMTITRSKGGLRYIFFEDSNLMIPRTKIDL
ncbi:hypothetical protein Hanom_Chr15g01407161 [Helianthus anomalus]